MPEEARWWRRRLWAARVAAHDLYEMLNEGDLVFFSGRLPHERCMQAALRTTYQHVSIVVVVAPL